MTPLRVLLVDPSDRGGIAAYSDRLAELLAADGCAVTLLTSSARSAPAGVVTMASLPRQRWGRGERESTPAFYARRLRTALTSRAILLRAVRACSPDVVHLQAEIVRSIDPLLVAELRRRVRVVVTAHDVQPLDGGPPQLAWLRAADAVIVHGEPARAFLAEHGIQASVIAHLPAAVPAAAGRDRSRAAARRELGLPAEGRLLAALGFIRDYKGYDLLAETWERLGPAAPQLLVVGEPWNDADRAVLARLAATGKVDVLAGFASDLTLALAARAADAVLLPYLRASDSGLLHLARATGTPVLVSDVPQLAAATLAGQAGTVLVRDAAIWASAVTGPLPAVPPVPPSPAQTAADHRAVYLSIQAGGAESSRLLVVSDAPSWGGAEAVLAMAIHGLAKRWTTTVLGVAPDVLARLVDAATGSKGVLVPPVGSKTDVRAIARQAAAIRRARPDVVLVNLRVPWAAQYATAVALLLPGVAVVAVEHYPAATDSGFQRHLKRLTARRLSAHLAVSDAAARRVEAVAGLPAGSVRTVRNAIRPATAAPAADLPAGLSCPCIVAVGRLDPVKGFDVLLRAVAQLPGVCLWLVGDGPERPALEGLRDELDLAARVQLPGWRADPRPALAAANVVVLSSRYESAPLVAAEALQVGAALVATDVGGVAELVGDAAILVPPDDPTAMAAAIRSVLDDAALRATLGERARRVAAQLPTPAQMADAYHDVLVTAVAQVRGTSPPPAMP